MFCEVCGNRIQDGERFCSVCGNPVKRDTFSAEELFENGSMQSSGLKKETENAAELPKKNSDIMAGMGYGFSQEQHGKNERDAYEPPKRKPDGNKGKNKKKRDEDLDEELRKEEQKEKITFAILGVIIVALVVAIVAGIIFLVNSGGSKENERVQRMTEEQVNDLTHGNKDENAEVTPEVTENPTPEVTQEATQEVTPEVTEDPVQEVTPVPTQEVTPKPTREAAPAPTKAPVVVVEEDSDYIIPDSSTRYLTNADLKELSEWEIRVARNEIYARHGRMFVSEELADYFGEKSWYHPSIPADQFDNSYLNGIEIENLKFITDYEKAHNLNQ